MRIAKSLKADLDESVRLYFAPVTAVVREFRNALGRRNTSAVTDREEWTQRLREREADLLRTMRSVEKTIAKRRRDFERRVS